jgi:hypothetical protein
VRSDERRRQRGWLRGRSRGRGLRLARGHCGWRRGSAASRVVWRRRRRWQPPAVRQPVAQQGSVWIGVVRQPQQQVVQLGIYRPKVRVLCTLLHLVAASAVRLLCRGGRRVVSTPCPRRCKGSPAWSGAESVPGCPPEPGREWRRSAAAARREFCINGLRIRDIRRLLYPVPTGQLQEQRRRSAAVTRNLRLLCAHGLIERVP